MTAEPSSETRAADPQLRRRQIRHDLRHEVSTVTLLASLLADADDVGSESRERARQLTCEANWLHRLLEEYERVLADPETSGALATPIRLDVTAAEVVQAIRLCGTPIRLQTNEAWARIDRLAFWRVLRNLVDNAVRAAGPNGRVEVRVRTARGWAVTQIDDDGPGFGAGSPGTASLGLGIARGLLAACGGDLEVLRRARHGCRVRMLLPAVVPPPHRAD